jgi:hypothetical protein
MAGVSRSGEMPEPTVKVRMEESGYRPSVTRFARAVAFPFRPDCALTCFLKEAAMDQGPVPNHKATARPASGGM